MTLVGFNRPKLTLSMRVFGHVILRAHFGPRQTHKCDPFWENPYKRGLQLFLFVFTYRIYGARGPRLPSLTEITQVFFELWIKTFMHNRSIIISLISRKRVLTRRYGLGACPGFTYTSRPGCQELQNSVRLTT